MPVLFRRLPRLAAFIAIVTLWPVVGLAQSGDIFSVRKVQEDIHDESPVQARSRALLLGQRDAYQLLMQRLTAPNDWARIPKLDDNGLEDLVQDVGIDQERILSARYLASISVRFKPDAVRHLLRNANIAYAEWRGRPLILLPLWQTEAGLVANDGVNPWRDIWRQGGVQGLVPVQLPANDIIDFASPDKLAMAGPDILAEIGQRAGSPDILVVTASSGKSENGLLKLDLTLTGQGPLAGQMSGQRGLGGDVGESLDLLLQRAATELARSLDENWKAGNLLQYDKGGSLMVAAPLASFEDWLTIREKLARSTAVRGFDVSALSKTEAAMTLHFVGEQGQLESILMQNGLVLTSEDGHWTLRNTTARGK